MATLNEMADKFTAVRSILEDLSISHVKAAGDINYLFSEFKTSEASVRRWRKSRVDPDYALDAADAAVEALKPITSTLTWGPAFNVLESISEPQEAVGPKILYIDIEMTPNLVHTWKLWQADIWHENIVVPSEMICFSAKWEGQPTLFYSVFHDSKQEMLQQVWNLLDAADVVIHFYGKSFDIPKINTELLLAGFSPPSPFKQIDICLQMKKRFSLPSNKLDYISKILGTSGKKKGIGYENWLKVMANDPAAWKIMKEYSIQDTEVLPEIFHKVKGWFTHVPNFAAITGKFVCPACGSDTLEKRGFTYTSVSAYQRYHCTKCGKWSRDTKRISGAGITAISD